MRDFLSESVTAEAMMALTSVFIGMVYGFAYDTIRIIRRLILHRDVLWIAVEDIVFWIAVAIHGYVTLYQGTDGVIRGYIVIGAVAGSILYRYAFGKFYLRYAVKVMRLFVNKVLKK